MHVNLKFVLDYYFEVKVATHLHRCPLGKHYSFKVKVVVLQGLNNNITLSFKGECC